jgi:hypothetical protein
LVNINDLAREREIGHFCADLFVGSFAGVVLAVS